nr:secondary metabolism regulator lae1 [Quercus suber]
MGLTWPVRLRLHRPRSCVGAIGTMDDGEADGKEDQNGGDRNAYADALDGFDLHRTVGCEMTGGGRRPTSSDGCRGGSPPVPSVSCEPSDSMEAHVRLAAALPYRPGRCRPVGGSGRCDQPWKDDQPPVSCDLRLVQACAKLGPTTGSEGQSWTAARPWGEGGCIEPSRDQSTAVVACSANDTRGRRPHRWALHRLHTGQSRAGQNRAGCRSSGWSCIPTARVWRREEGAYLRSARSHSWSPRPRTRECTGRDRTKKEDLATPTAIARRRLETTSLFLHADSSCSIPISSLLGPNTQPPPELKTVIHGRQYYRRWFETYPYPCDEPEKDRLDAFHHAFYRVALDNRLHEAILPRGKKRVLDLGSGTGIWAIEMAAKYPDSEIIAIDIGDAHPQIPGVDYGVDWRTGVDFNNDNWGVPENYFDLIHMGCLCGAVPDWAELFRKVER